MTTPTSVAAEIEQLARQGATSGELLEMLPMPSLRTALYALQQAMAYIVLDDDDIDQVAAVARVLQAELDSRS